MINIITVEKDQRNSQFVEKLLKVWEDSVRASHYFLTEEDIIELIPQAEEALRCVEILWVMQDEQKIIVHAPYVLNLANDSDYDKLQKAKEFLKSELIRTEAFGSQILVFHPGAHIGKGSDYGIKLILELSNEN